MRTPNLIQVRHISSGARFLPFAEAREVARKLCVRSLSEFRALRKNRPSGIPSNPHEYYRNFGFVNSGDFFGYSSVPRTVRKSASAGLLPVTMKVASEIEGKKFIENLLRDKAPHVTLCFSPFRHWQTNLFLCDRQRVEGAADITTSTWLPVQLKSISNSQNVATKCVRHPSVPTILVSPSQAGVSFRSPLQATNAGTFSCKTFDHDTDSAPVAEILEKWFAQIQPLSFAEITSEFSASESTSKKATLLLWLADNVLSRAGFPVRFMAHATAFWSISIGPWCCVYRTISESADGRVEVKLKRNSHGFLVPMAENDPVDFFVFAVTAGSLARGCFLLPRTVLAERGYLTMTNGDDGKLTMTLFPSFVRPQSKRAQVTQQWQFQYYLDLDGSRETVVEKAREILSAATT